MSTSNVSAIAKSVCMTLTSVSIPQIHRVLIAIAFSVFALVTILSNAILMYTLYNTKQLNTISNKLILAMSISDFCLGAIAFPMIAFRNFKRNAFKRCTPYKASQGVTLFFAYFSLILLYCISINWHFKVTKLNR